MSFDLFSDIYPFFQHTDRFGNSKDAVVQEQEGPALLGTVSNFVSAVGRGDWPADWNLVECLPFVGSVGTTKDDSENKGCGWDPVHSYLPERWPVLLGHLLSAT